MQKLNTLLCILALILTTGFAQKATPGAGTAAEITYSAENFIQNYSINKRIVLPEGAMSNSSQSGSQDQPEVVSSFTLDNMRVDNLTSSTGRADTFAWPAGNNITGVNSMRYIVTGFPILIDESDTIRQYANHIVVIDTVFLTINHTNVTGQNNTLRISIHALNPANNYFESAALWTQDITVNQSLGGGVLPIPIDYAMCDGAFAVRAEYLAPAADEMFFFAGYQTGCQDTCGAADLTFGWPSSFYGRVDGTGAVSDLPRPDMPGSTNYNLIYADCNGTQTRDTCEYWPLQNWLLAAKVSITDLGLDPLAATFSSTPDNGIGSGTAWANITGGTGDYSITWGTTPQQMGDTAMNLPAGNYQVAITYGTGCETFVGDVTVDSNVGIDLGSAGINTMDAYPNPTNGLITLDMELNSRDDVRLQIISTTGKVVFEASESQVDRLRQSVNLSDVAAGIYMLNVTTSRGSATQRILVN